MRRLGELDPSFGRPRASMPRRSSFERAGASVHAFRDPLLAGAALSPESPIIRDLAALQMKS